VTSICVGVDIDGVLRRIEAAPSRYAQIIICSPFIDLVTSRRIDCLAQSAFRAGCGVRIITAPNSNTDLRMASLPGRDQVGNRNFVILPHLHAKVYLAIGRNFRDSWVTVTSANATEAGLKRNIELGLLVRATSPEGARTVEQVRHFLEKLARVPKER
jgi:phosphatidylserine/phosphatidylglycerophosphate/cardiolipin synthase-like enzyme